MGSVRENFTITQSASNLLLYIGAVNIKVAFITEPGSTFIELTQGYDNF